MCAFCRHTRRRFERTHGDVLSIHTWRREGRRGGGGGGVGSLLSSLFFPLSNDVNDRSSSRLSLCTHGSNLPEDFSACTLVHSLSGEHVRIMQETTVLV